MLRLGAPVAVLATLAVGSTLAADGDVARYDLDNGLEVYVLEKHTAPVVAVQVWYDTGAIKEHVGIRGLSHLFEHMMFRGSANFGPEEHAQLISEHGGWNNAYTSDDVTVYHEVVPASALALVLELEADRMGRLALDDEMFTTEREVVKEEYRQNYENNPYGKLLLKLRREMYGDHPYSWGPIGVMGDLDALTVEDCRDYYRRHYAPDNATLVVAGDVDPEEVLSLARGSFGAIPASRSATPDPDPPILEGPRVLAAKEDFPVFFSGVGYALPPAGHDDTLALEVLIGLLSKHLERALTVRDNICVYAVAELFEFKQVSAVGFLGVHLPNVTPDRVISAVDREVVDFLANGLTEDALARPRNEALLAERIKRYSSNSLADGLGDAVVIEGDLDGFLDRPERIAALSSEDLLAVAERYFVPENRADIRIEPTNPSALLRIAGWLMSLLPL